ncbi:MAG: hypothetical protein ABL886_00365 [Rhodoglobus sp.]
MTSARNQARYQVRFALGADGAREICDGAHILVWADAIDTGDLDPLTLGYAGVIVAGTTGSRDAVAAWVLERQAELGDRIVVAVVAAGGPGGGYAVEDIVAAGAVIEALAELGIDSASPEAAAVGGSWIALRNAGSHVLSASVAGQSVLATGESLDAARETQGKPSVRVIRELPPTQ